MVRTRGGGSSQARRDEEHVERRRPTASARRERVGVAINEEARAQAAEARAQAQRHVFRPQRHLLRRQRQVQRHKLRLLLTTEMDFPVVRGIHPSCYHMQSMLHISCGHARY